jgi:formiminotetrahydrofolate cyclodeaminase
MPPTGPQALAERSIIDLLADLGDGRLSGAAGCAAALTGALAGALVMMAARAEPAGWEDAAATIAQADVLSQRLSELADRDSHAHRHALHLLALPSQDDDDEHRPDRDHQLADALHEAAAAPLAIAEAAADIALLAAWVARVAPVHVHADVQAAASLADGAAHAAANLVTINLAVRAEDPLAVRARAAADTAARAHHDTPHPT